MSEQTDIQELLDLTKQSLREQRAMRKSVLGWLFILIIVTYGTLLITLQVYLNQWENNQIQKEEKHMRSDPEVNAPMFRDIRWGETVIIDRVKLWKDYYAAAKRHHAFIREARGNDSTKVISEVPHKPLLTAEANLKRHTLDIAWCLMQPWCEVQKSEVYNFKVHDVHYCHVDVQVPMELLHMCARLFSDVLQSNKVTGWVEYAVPHLMVPCKEVASAVEVLPDTGNDFSLRKNTVERFCMPRVYVLTTYVVEITSDYVRFALLYMLPEDVMVAYRQWSKTLSRSADLVQ